MRTAKHSVGLEKLFHKAKAIDFCACCSKSKMTKGAHFKWSRFKPSPSPFAHVSMDLIGKWKEKSLGGNDFILTIVCRHSKWVQCYPLPSNHSTVIVKAFKQFLVDVRALLGKDSSSFPSVVMTDWGTEFAGAFKDYCLEKEIKMEKSCPYAAWHSRGMKLW